MCVCIVWLGTVNIFDQSYILCDIVRSKMLAASTTHVRNMTVSSTLGKGGSAFDWVYEMCHNFCHTTKTVASSFSTCCIFPLHLHPRISFPLPPSSPSTSTPHLLPSASLSPSCCSPPIVCNNRLVFRMTVVTNVVVTVQCLSRCSTTLPRLPDCGCPGVLSLMTDCWLLLCQLLSPGGCGSAAV